MNLLVLLHSLLDPAGFTVNRRAQKIFVNRENYIVNPSDKNALEAALRLDAHVTAAAFDGPYAEDALRQARALGAHRALLIKDAALKSAEACVLTNVLQRVIQRLGDVDLVMLGAETPQADLAQIAPRLAAALDWPGIFGAHRVEVENGVVRAIAPRLGVFHAAEADLPAIVTLARDSNKPRYPRGLDLVNAYRTPDAVEVLALANLGLAENDLAPVAELRGESFPPERELGKRLEGNLDEMANQLANVIRMK